MRESMKTAIGIGIIVFIQLSLLKLKMFTKKKNR